MLNAPQIGERCMDAYMCVKFGAGDNGVSSNEVDNNEAISVLKRIHHPTTDKQVEVEDDERKLSRSISTALATVKQDYLKSELVHEWDWTKTIFQERNWMPDLPTLQRPTSSSAYNKESYAMAICQARDINKRKDPMWANNTQSAIQSEIDTRDSETNNTINEKMNDAIHSYFFKLHMNDEVHNAYSETIQPEDNNDHQQSQNSTGSYVSAGALLLMDI